MGYFQGLERIKRGEDGVEWKTRLRALVNIVEHQTMKPGFASKK